MKYQNKGDDNWHQTSNNYACWHNTLFFFLFYCSYHAPFLEVQDRRGCAGVCLSICLSVWPGQLDRADHACLPALCLCALRCASNIYPRPELLFLTPVQHPDTQTEPTEVSLSTAINKDFFRGISSYVTVVYLLFKVIKRLCRCPLE